MSDEARLRHMGPLEDGGFGIELEGGPIPAIAEYLANMLGMRDLEPSNYVEMQVNRADLGAMILTLQRVSGKTPHQLRQKAEDEVVRLRAVLESIATVQSAMPVTAMRSLAREGLRATPHLTP